MIFSGGFSARAREPTQLRHATTVFCQHGPARAARADTASKVRPCADRAFVRAPRALHGGLRIHFSREHLLSNSVGIRNVHRHKMRPALSRHTGSWLGGGEGSPIRSLPQSGTKGGSRVYNMGSDGAEAHACAPARHPCPTPASPTPAAEAKQKRAVSHGAAASCIDTSLARSLHGHTHTSSYTTAGAQRERTSRHVPTPASPTPGVRS